MSSVDGRRSRSSVSSMPVQSAVSSRVPFRAPPRWLAPVLVVLAVAFAGHFFVASAQIRADVVERVFIDCLQDPGNPHSLAALRRGIADDVPGVGTRGAFVTVTLDAFMGEIFLCGLELGNTVIGPIGWNLLWPLALIMTVWFGVTVMFSGGDPMEGLNFLLRVGLAFMLLENYFFETPRDTPFGESQGVVWTVARQGIIMGRTLVDDANDFAEAAYNEAREASRERLVGRLARAMLDPGGNYTPAEEAEAEAAARLGVELREEDDGYRWYVSRLENFWRLFLWIIKWMVYAQYLWAFVGLTVIGILGPLFIPWMLVPQLDWLFWSWFRALLQVTIQMMTSAVMYVVAAMILTIPLAQLANLQYDAEPESVGELAYFTFNLMVPFLPIILMLWSASLKVGAVASGLMSGGGMTGAGLAGGMGVAARLSNVAAVALNSETRAKALRAARVNLGAAGMVVGEGYRAGRRGDLLAMVPFSRRATSWREAKDVVKEYYQERHYQQRRRGRGKDGGPEGDRGPDRGPSPDGGGDRRNPWDDV